jgi:hypothetical protein
MLERKAWFPDVQIPLAKLKIWICAWKLGVNLRWYVLLSRSIECWAHCSNWPFRVQVEAITSKARKKTGREAYRRGRLDEKTIDAIEQTCLAVCILSRSDFGLNVVNCSIIECSYSNTWTRMEKVIWWLRTWKLFMEKLLIKHFCSLIRYVELISSSKKPNNKSLT